MPIHVSHPIRVLSQEEFHDLNHGVLGIVFDVHNEFGRLLEEAVFKAAIAMRWNGHGKVNREVPIRVTHDGFSKDYFMDMFFDDGLMLEAKVAECITGGHRAQTLHYLMLGGMNHGTLVNLRPVRVEHEFVSTTLTHEARRNVKIITDGWKRDAGSDRLASCAETLLRDWGAYLEVSLYREAIAHLLNLGEPKAVNIYDGNQLIGHQPMLMLNDSTAVACTAIHDSTETAQRHLQRLHSHTRLNVIQWLNFNRNVLELRTVTTA